MVRGCEGLHKRPQNNLPKQAPEAAETNRRRDNIEKHEKKKLKEKKLKQGSAEMI